MYFSYTGQTSVRQNCCRRACVTDTTSKFASTTNSSLNGTKCASTINRLDPNAHSVSVWRRSGETRVEDYRDAIGPAEPLLDDAALVAYVPDKSRLGCYPEWRASNKEKRYPSKNFKSKDIVLSRSPEPTDKIAATFVAL